MGLVDKNTGIVIARDVRTADSFFGRFRGLMLKGKFREGEALFFTFKKPVNEAGILPYNSLVTGIVMTGGNPYFFLWWATIGIALIARAMSFGIYALVLLIIIHWSCDIVWEQIISMTVFRTRHLWTPHVQKIIFGVCAVVLIVFGIYFGISVFL